MPKKAFWTINSADVIMWLKPVLSYTPYSGTFSKSVFREPLWKLPLLNFLTVDYHLEAGGGRLRWLVNPSSFPPLQGKVLHLFAARTLD